LFVLVVPILDTGLVIVSRARRGLIPFAAPGKDHTAHRIANLGLSRRAAVLVLYGVALAGGTVALIASETGDDAPYFASAGAVIVAAAIALLERVSFEKQVPAEKEDLRAELETV
jgi:UDP-GlcNAc:undecaprenyl-phosphate GlcNAc-1-phosphate transferase